MTELVEHREEHDFPMLPTPNDNNNDDHDESPLPQHDQQPSLPMPLRVLFGLNGVTLALPSTALMYIVNTRAEIPVAYLSAYGAISFLPFSLKPLYAWIQQQQRSRGNCLLVTLLIWSGISIICTALIPPNGVAWCFLLGFVRGILVAFPEFLLGLCLIRHARDTGNYKVAAAHLQSQAATARNFGSLVANIMGFLVFMNQYFHHKEELTHGMVTLLLVATGFVNFGAAMIASYHHVGSKLNHTLIPQEDDDRNELQSPPCDMQECTPPTSSPSSVGGNCVAICVFQLTIVVFAMRGPIVSLVSNVMWICLMVLLGTTLCILIYCKRQQTHKVGIFLLLRHALPSTSWLVSSFVYSKLQATPMMLQALSMVSGGVATLSSWSYGKVLAPFSQGKYLLAIIAFTTGASSLVSLGNLVMLNADSDNVWSFFVLVLVIQVVTGFFGEWQFLPDVVLATAAVDVSEPTVSSEEMVEKQVTFAMKKEPSYHQVHQQSSSSSQPTVDTTGMQYGTLIACIDFGDQIGAWVTVPLVAALDISRENDWAHLDIMIVLTAALGLMSVALIGLIKDV